ncbi:putative UDP-Gal or UDP-GlcNAc-dependent glycosyltransferase [Trypanosoma cruzi]|uniref:Putative UDP-Gal or UDP-GlcNAc-dependent glycosyltransferase n=1 Tax=Trypanosoma cruzi TaxID=5693 RepID=A0A2V2UM40_TRYCR|nr:putative UDP-Gal or UDP-GlcNAc-dependent glycosyltransferase [Trypanosoma cruzi]
MMVHRHPTTSATREPPQWTTQRLLTSHAVLWIRGAGGSIWLCWASPPPTTRRGEHDATCSGRRAGGSPEWRRGRTTSPVRCLCCTSLGGTRRTATTTLPRCWRRASQWNDVVALPMNEGRVTTNKTIGSYGSWGDEANVGFSRKTYMWLDLAHRLFLTARYIAKGDDDMFLRVPLFVCSPAPTAAPRDLHGIPHASSLWSGKIYKSYTFMVGWCYTLSRDVAEALVSYKPLRRLAYLPYSKERDHEFAPLLFYEEDVMVGGFLGVY